jgi:hypothetical protein
MHVLFKAMYWCRQWALLQPSEVNTKEINDAYRALEMTAMQIFINYGWGFRNRLNKYVYLLICLVVFNLEPV